MSSTGNSTLDDFYDPDSGSWFRFSLWILFLVAGASTVLICIAGNTIVVRNEELSCAGNCAMRVFPQIIFRMRATFHKMKELRNIDSLLHKNAARGREAAVSALNQNNVDVKRIKATFESHVQRIALLEGELKLERSQNGDLRERLDQQAGAI